MDAKRGVDEIANRFFSRREADTLRGLPAELRIAAFFNCWTRKEAYINALGEGLSLPLASFDVAFGPQVTPALLRVDSCSHELSRWRLYDIPAGPGYAAAIVVEGQEHRLQNKTWEWAKLTPADE
jgi:4'-phosphopantetheinyl transferase